MKSIYFYPFNSLYEDSYATALYSLEKGLGSEVCTGQMAILNNCWDKGYNVYLVSEDGKDFIKIFVGMSVNGKELRKSHNILKLWLAGAFGDKFTPKNSSIV